MTNGILLCIRLLYLNTEYTWWKKNKNLKTGDKSCYLVPRPTLVVVGLTKTQSVPQSPVLNHICELYMKYAQYAQYDCLGSNMQNMQNMQNILLCCFILNLFYLLLLEDAVNANITPVQRDGRQAQRRVRCIMVFVQKTCNFVRKHRHKPWLSFLSKFRKSGNMFLVFRVFGKPSEIFGNLGRIYWVAFFGGWSWYCSLKINMFISTSLASSTHAAEAVAARCPKWD